MRGNHGYNQGCDGDHENHGCDGDHKNHGCNGNHENHGCDDDDKTGLLILWLMSTTAIINNYKSNQCSNWLDA